MFRGLLTNQQRSFHQSALRWSYSRKALRRLKKPELLALAGRHHIDASGTKNDLIDRLLLTNTQQTSSDNNNTNTNPTPPPAISTRVEKVTPPPTTESVSATPNLASSSSSSSSPAASSSSEVLVSNTLEVNNDDEGYDQQWVEAFDLKVGNRRSGMNGLGRDRGSLTRQDTKRHPTSSSSGAAASSAHSGYVHQTVGVDPASNPNLISTSAHRPTADDPFDGEPLDPEINQHWVKVFDQRVKTRTKIMGLNTLDTNPKMPEQPSTIESTGTTTTTTTDDSSSDNDTRTSSTGNSNKAVNMAIGTTLTAWYFLGGDGIQTVLSSFFS